MARFGILSVGDQFKLVIDGWTCIFVKVWEKRETYENAIQIDGVGRGNAYMFGYDDEVIVEDFT